MPHVIAQTKVLKSSTGKEATLNLTNNFNFDYIGTFYVGNPP